MGHPPPHRTRSSSRIFKTAVVILSLNYCFCTYSWGFGIFPIYQNFTPSAFLCQPIVSNPPLFHTDNAFHHSARLSSIGADSKQTAAYISIFSTNKFPSRAIQPSSSPPVEPSTSKERIPMIAVKTLILEAVGEGHQGMVAVAEVIRNRSKKFNKRYDEICLAPKQFSCWNDKIRAKNFLRKHQIFFKDAKKAWLESSSSSLTKGATDYHTVAVDPYWAKCYRRVAKIGSHLFYCRK